jgi:hypothetical protein
LTATDFFTQLAAGSDGQVTLISPPDYPFAKAPAFMRPLSQRLRVQSASFD